MFQSITKSSIGNNSNSYQIIDSEFESVAVKATGYIECFYPRLVLCEYSQRRLNVACNLKQYYRWLFKTNNIVNTREALSIINSDHKILTSNHYEFLKFQLYYECLIRDVKRLEYIGLLK